VREDNEFYTLSAPIGLARYAALELGRALVKRRKGERAWVLAHPGPATYGKDQGPPPWITLDASLTSCMDQH